MGSFIVNILMVAAVVHLEYTFAVPSYGRSFLGYQYWNTRCEMNYQDDWLGYWNNKGTRTEYKRSSVGSSSTNCLCEDPCSNGELQCSTFGGTKLYVYAGIATLFI